MSTCGPRAQVRVVDTAAKPIVIKNTGKYGISFNFKVKGASKDVFSVVPDTGAIDPGKDMTVQVWRECGVISLCFVMILGLGPPTRPLAPSLHPQFVFPQQVHFNQALSLRRELTPNMFGANDIVLSIIEPLTNNKEETLPIKVGGYGKVGEGGRLVHVSCAGVCAC